MSLVFKILLIEDEKNIQELVKYNLEQEGWKVSAAGNGVDGVAKARKESPDLILLDLMLPKMDGLEVCKVLKRDAKTNTTPIIMLTAKGEEVDKIIGLELGADDYMAKPFSPRELVARIKAIMRRLNPENEKSVLKLGALQMDLERHEVHLKGKPVNLTSKEFNLLKTLIQANGRVLSREHLLSTVWGYDQSLEIETRTVDMHIGQLRKKVKAEASRIMTVKNEWYRIVEKS
jgi:DNA-binding response OmpR family regulator